jgi:mannose-1-phosphate guanylyltransferase
LLPIANRPHIEHVFDLLQGHGISEVILTTSYLAEAFISTIAAARRRGVEVEVAYEEVALGTAGAIKNAEALLGDETFLVLNADVLTGADLGALVSLHGDRDAEATILLSAVEDPTAFGVVSTDREGRVTGFIEKPSREEAPSNLISAGVYVMEPDVLERIPPDEEWSTERSVWPQIVEAGSLYALESEAYWMDVGTPAKYLQANVDALEGRFTTDAMADPHPGASLVHELAVVGQGAEVSSSCLATGAEIGSGAVVERSVLLPGARIGERAVVRGSVLGEGAVVAAGARVEDLTAGDGETVGGNEEG